MHICCFHILVVIKSAAQNIEMHDISFKIMFFFFSGYVSPEVGLQGHMVALFLVF